MLAQNMSYFQGPRSNFEGVGGGGGDTVSDSILGGGGAQDTLK